MNFQPLGNRVLVKRVEEATTTASGIYIPDNAKEKPLNGKVVAISKGIAEQGQININATVVFGKYAGTELTIDGKEYLVMEEKEILGILK